jgi:hypothetical protein
VLECRDCGAGTIAGKRKNRTHIHSDVAHDTGVVRESNILAFVVHPLFLSDAVRSGGRDVFYNKGAFHIYLHCAGVGDGIFEAAGRFHFSGEWL